MERKPKHYFIEEVLSKAEDPNKIDRKDAKKDFDGDMINTASWRYWTFKHKGIKCIKCGIEGKFFLKERHKDSEPYHFNLYALDENGQEILMTKDHAIPISKGGVRHNLDNLQPMCAKCNFEKDSL